MSGRVVETGQALVDVVLDVPHLPAPGSDVFATRSGLQAGGDAHRVLAARRDGADVVHAGGHGTGPLGDLVRAALTGEGVVLTAAAHPHLDTGLSVVLVEPGAERTFVSTRGAEALTRVEDLRAAGVGPGDAVVVSGYSLLHPAKAAVLLAWVAELPSGVLLALDLGPLVAELPADPLDRLMGRVDLWTGSAAEARHVAGVATAGGAPADDLRALATAVAGRLARRSGQDARVVVRDGARGCAVVGDGPAVLLPALRVAAVDTNGAGDVHTGVLLAGLLRGTGLRGAARRANAAAALSVTRRGPGSAPSAAQTDAALAAAAGSSR